MRWYLITKRLCLIDSGQYSVEPLKPVRVLPQNNFFDMGIRIRWESLPILPSPPQRNNARCNSNHDTTFYVLFFFFKLSISLSICSSSNNNNNNERHIPNAVINSPHGGQTHRICGVFDSGDDIGGGFFRALICVLEPQPGSLSQRNPRFFG